ncbi:MAG: T9SS type A sorting domain-containing protein [Bacteroidetes bacterium]|nr:T9SS type A sorting domain-containing protein [Bacteroidota bacterium]
MRILSFSLLLGLLGINSLFSQTAIEKQFHFPIKGKLVFKELPEVAASIRTKEEFNSPIKRLDPIKPKEQRRESANLNKKTGIPGPQVFDMFPGQTPNGTPLDNNIAVSKAGLVFSVANTTVRVLDSSGKFLFSRSLSAIANQLGTLNRTFDPHTLYDAENDRFILVFLNGSDHTNTELVIGFSQTNDPRDAWIFYSLPGNTTSNDWWSDYPFIGISDDALFISVILWKDGESGWDTDASDNTIWKIKLEDGYAGKQLETRQFSGLEYGGIPLWNIRPMSKISSSGGAAFYLLTNRPKDVQNDTLFLIRVDSSWDTTKPRLSLFPIKLDQAYGLQPNVTQKGGRRLRTNYCDIQNGYFFNGNVYFCSNSIHPSSGRPGVYVGKIVDVEGSRIATGEIFGVDSLDLNYPSMTYAGAGWPDESALIMCLHNSQNSYPGTSVFSLGREGGFSDLVRVKEGEGMIRTLVGYDSLDRWGDYTGIQKDYAQTGKAWIAGSFGLSSGISQTWIAHIGSSDPQLAIQKMSEIPARVYPNPGQVFKLQFHLETDQAIQVQLMDMDGKLVFARQERLIAGDQELSIDPGASAGVYLLLVKDRQGKILIQEKLVVR